MSKFSITEAAINNNATGRARWLFSQFRTASGGERSCTLSQNKLPGYILKMKKKITTILPSLCVIPQSAVVSAHVEIVEIKVWTSVGFYTIALNTRLFAKWIFTRRIFLVVLDILLTVMQTKFQISNYCIGIVVVPMLPHILTRVLVTPLFIRAMTYNLFELFMLITKMISDHISDLRRKEKKFGIIGRLS